MSMWEPHTFKVHYINMFHPKIHIINNYKNSNQNTITGAGWYLPGGKSKDLNEPFMDIAWREFSEETGLSQDSKEFNNIKQSSQLLNTVSIKNKFSVCKIHIMGYKTDLIMDPQEYLSIKRRGKYSFKLIPDNTNNMDKALLYYNVINNIH